MLAVLTEGPPLEWVIVGLLVSWIHEQRGPFLTVERISDTLRCGACWGSWENPACWVAFAALPPPLTPREASRQPGYDMAIGTVNNRM